MSEKQYPTRIQRVSKPLIIKHEWTTYYRSSWGRDWHDWKALEIVNKAGETVTAVKGEKWTKITPGIHTRGLFGASLALAR